MNEGAYAPMMHFTCPGPSLRTAAEILWFMSSNPVLRQKEAPTLAKADDVLDKFVGEHIKTGDANDVLYAVEASHDYDPGRISKKFTLPLLAINSADDLINPPEFRILEREIKHVPRARCRDSIERQDARPRQPHSGGVVEGEVAETPQGNGKVTVDHPPQRAGCGYSGLKKMMRFSPADIPLANNGVLWACKFSVIRIKSGGCLQRRLHQRGTACSRPRGGQLYIKPPIPKHHRSMRSARSRSSAKFIGARFIFFYDDKEPDHTMRRI